MESKTYVFNPESGTSGTGSNGILAMLPALMQRQGVDPGLIALLNNRGNGNGWGEDIFAILLLFILMGNNGMGFFGGNRCMGSNGQGGVVPMLNNDANTAVIMQAVQRNGFDVQSLATALNTSSDAVMAAINGLGHQICNLGNQMGMNANQILTAIMQGNNAIATQLAECCCKTNNAITAMDGNLKLSICQQTHAINDTANANALMLRDKADANNQSVLAKLDQMRKYNPVTKKDEEVDYMDKEKVESILTKQGVTLENNVGYDHVYVANMVKADFYKSSIEDEAHMALFVKDMVDDTDQKDGFIFNRFYADCNHNGIGIPWDDIL